MKKYFKNEQALAQKGEIKLGSGEDSTQVLSYYLRDHQGRSDLSQLLQVAKPEKNSFSKNLEEIRNLLANGDIEEANNLIGSTPAIDVTEKLELLLEKSRYRYFRNEFESAITLLEIITKQEETLPISRLTAFQLLGVCYYQLGQPETAIEALKKVVNLWEIFPYAHSGASGAAHLVKIYSDQKDFTAADRVLTRMQGWLEEQAGADLWLSRQLLFLRAKYHFHKNKSERTEAAELLKESFVLAKWLGDWEVVAVAEADLKILGIEIKIGTWEFLKFSEVILITNPLKAHFLKDKPVLKGLLISLLNSPKTEEELFMEVWGMNYSNERHSDHLRKTLSKLRKILPVRTINGLIKLN
jgi:tetratricopeptide (TPR) repeat protein